ncbi:MAG: radical SAM family heme chaperone HemW [Paramuribaculum sp.]|nr:radical SAM family heme chaperone HemW [Paramuribaculum sp.]
MAGLYIHIPYCRSKCAYCDFYSTPRTESAKRYVEALAKEYISRRDEITDTITTKYIGGGTPSSLPEPLLRKVMTIGSEEPIEEFTIEVNPEDVTDELLMLLKQYGVNRISMGVQTLNDDELHAVGRRHNARKAIESMHMLRNAGFSNISLDLIYGLPIQTVKSWETTLKQIIQFRPQHISAYSLMYEPGTKLTAMLQSGKLQPINEDDSALMYDILCDMLATEGYEQYEISNFCLPNYHSRHNSAYWNFTPYLGIGAAAHSYDGIIRRANPTSVKKYLELPEHSFTEEFLSTSERIEEYIMLRLRTTTGLSIDEFTQLFNDSACTELLNKATGFIKSGSLILNNNRLYIPQSHFLTADAIIIGLF